MLHLMFSIYDDKAEAYLSPFYMKTVGEALRVFADSANDPNSMISKHPSDFTIFQLGTFDDGNAAFALNATPHALGKAIEYKTQREPIDPTALVDMKGGV